MNAKYFSESLLASVDYANKEDVDLTVKSGTHGDRTAQRRRLDRAECLLAHLSGRLESCDPAIAGAIKDFLRTSKDLTNNEMAAKHLAAGERFTSPAPEPAKAARQ